MIIQICDGNKLRGASDIQMIVCPPSQCSNRFQCISHLCTILFALPFDCTLRARWIRCALSSVIKSFMVFSFIFHQTNYDCDIVLSVTCIPCMNCLKSVVEPTQMICVQNQCPHVCVSPAKLIAFLYRSNFVYCVLVWLKITTRIAVSCPSFCEFDVSKINMKVSWLF